MERYWPISEVDETAPAAGLRGLQLVRGHPIGGIAVRTNEKHWVHGSLSENPNKGGHAAVACSVLKGNFIGVVGLSPFLNLDQH